MKKQLIAPVALSAQTRRWPLRNVIIYSLLCLTFGVFISWLRLASGSVFVAAMAHSAYNTFFQDLFDHSFAGPNKWFWAGEEGVLCSVVFGALAFWLYRTGRMPREDCNKSNMGNETLSGGSGRREPPRDTTTKART